MPDVVIEKLVFGGQGLGRLNGKVAFVWNALPGETVEVEIIQNKKTHIEAVAKKMLVSSSARQSPSEDHFLSCSPWQIISYEEENRWKKDIAIETYTKFGNFTPEEMDIVVPDESLHYRNKIEYSFAERPDGTIAYAFFERGKHRREPIDGCLLTDRAIANTATTILEWINRHRIPIRSLKSLILRSNRAGETIAGLFIKDKLSFSDLPISPSPCRGFRLFYSTHKSPASVPTAILAEDGQDYLEEIIRGKTLRYGLFSFFQIHLPIFEQALNDISAHIDHKQPFLDYYGGVGTIGIALGNHNTNLTIVDSNTEAIKFATHNVSKNQFTRAKTLAAPAEKMIDIITSNATLMLDPPRAGLHEYVTKKILETRPRQIVYLSCNIATHARDLARLMDVYQLSFLRTYNFFPRTPHIEGLAILAKK